MPMQPGAQPMTNPYAPPRAAVRDIPDQIGTTDPADLGTRLGAAILDSIILGATAYLPLMFAFFVRGQTAEAAGTMVILASLLTLTGLVTWSWITIVYVKRNGQSIAKKIMGIKVVRADGSAASLGRVFWLRNFVNALISIIPLYGIIEILFIFGESRQCLHDKLADTIVVKA
jgi:uncharacterized RDD family membrane protein YckC